MFPIRDNIPSRRFPAVTLGIILANVLVFLRELALGRRLDLFVVQYAIIPVRYTCAEIARQFSLLDRCLICLRCCSWAGGFCCNSSMAP